VAAQRQEQIEFTERSITALSNAIELLKTRISEIEDFQKSGLSYSISEAAKKLFRPVLIRLRVATHKSEEELEAEISNLIERAESNPRESFMVFMSPSLVSFVSGETETLSEPVFGKDNLELFRKFENLVQAREDQRQSDAHEASLSKAELEARLKESVSRRSQLQTNLVKLKPLEVSEISAERLASLRQKIGNSEIPSDSLAAIVLKGLPINLAEDLRITQLVATAMENHESELLLISAIVSNGKVLTPDTCSGCLLLRKACNCSLIDRVEKTFERLLENTLESPTSLIEKNWSKFYPYFYLQPGSAVKMIQASIPQSIFNLNPHLVEVISRLLLGDLLNFHWFKSDISQSQLGYRERMDLNQWTKSATRLSIIEIGEILRHAIPALAGDSELPIAWLLSVTNQAHEFPDELEAFLQSHIDLAGA
jgi:hypothetical protein